MAKLSDNEIKAIVDAELEAAIGVVGGDLADERADAMDRYLGEPLGTEMEGRSQVHTRDVMETIEWIMPTLITIFTDADSAVDIEPVGPEDEEQSQQETDYLNYLFYKKNEGFLILYTMFKDALLQKTGFTKAFAEESEKSTKESYFNLLDIEFNALNADEELELIEHSTSTQTIRMADTGQSVPIRVHDAVFQRTTEEVNIQIENVPPEEALVSRDARSPNIKKVRFKAHRTTKTVSELREMGYTDDDIGQMEFGDNETSISEEALARYHLADEEQWQDLVIQNTSMRKVKISECYLFADRDGDGIAERLKVIRSGNFVDVEEIDYDPFNAITPIILTHKFYGLSVADILHDLQEIRTMLFRSYMDNINQTLNGRIYYDMNTVNLDDMLTSKPYGLVANDGPPAQSVFIDRPNGLPAEAFSLNDLLDKFQHNRIGDIQSQLDPNVLAQANTGVVLSMLNEAKAKVFMIARIFAEIGLKPLFRDLHHLARKYSNREDVIKLRNNWVPVKPQEWRERTDFTVKVGLGIKGRREGLADIQSLIQMQMTMAQQGIPMVQPNNLYNSMQEFAERLGYMPEQFFTDPALIPPPEPQPDPQAEILRLTLEVENAKLQQKHIEAQMQNERQAEQNQIKAQELEIKARDVEVKAMSVMSEQELKRVQTDLGSIKNLSDAQKAQIDAVIKESTINQKAEAEQIQMALKAMDNQTKNELEKYKADLAAQVELLKMKPVDNRSDQLIAQLMDELTEMKGKLEEKEESREESVEIVYDADGRIVQIGNKRVERDRDGRALRLQRMES